MNKRVWLLVSLVWTVFGCCAAIAQQQNLVKNPGFEQVSADGAPVAWPAASAVYSISTEVARSGQRSLRWQNDDPERYALYAQDIPVDHGHMYEFEVWVKTENVTGSGSGATICIEWMKEDGTFIAGSYPNGIKGTTEGWQRVNGTTRKIPDDAASCHVVCYVRKGGVGTAYFDDVAVREYVPPLLGTMVTNCYRNRTTPAPFSAFASMSLIARELRTEDLIVDLQLLNADGEKVAEPTEVHLQMDRIEAQFDATGLAPGEYQVICEARTADGKQSGRASTAVTVVNSFGKRKAFIDAHGRLILDGEPFFPLGTYWGAVTTEHLDTYAKSSFNCLMPYHMIDREILDEADERDIKIIYSVKDLYKGRQGLKTEEEAEDVIRDKVRALRDHPTIMAWYINDEMPLERLPELTAHRDLLETLDPGRPTWVVLYQVGQVRQYLPTFDVIGTDPYPVPHKPVSTALRYTRMTTDAVFGARAVWMVPQIFNWASYRKEPEEKKEMRAPTLDEMRSMAWQCIAGGANGLVFYSWMDLWRMNKTLDQGGRALVREPFEERWADVSTMAAEIARFIPVLLSVERPATITRAAGDDAVATRVYAKDGRTYIIAVNSEPEPASLTLQTDRPIQNLSVELGEDSGIRREKALELSFDPLEVKIIALQIR